MAEKAGSLLQQMVPSIHRTSELVQEIVASSGEQADGVAQITGAMNHLNAATQQTASASEELSATAEELSAQAGHLQQLVEHFRLDDAADGARLGKGTALTSRTARTAVVARPAGGQPAPVRDFKNFKPSSVAGSARAVASPGSGAVDESSFTSF
jgi:methyl-accepting chemotaxis protein